MALPQFYRRQRSILGPLLQAFARLLGLVAGKPLTDAQFRDLVAVLTETSNSARHRVAEQAFEFYLEARPADADPLDPPTITDLPELYFEKVVQSHRPDLESENNASAGVTRITQAAVRSVENAGRETVQAATQIDPAAVAWARVLTGAESCGWCAMLASRGPVYNSKIGATKKTGTTRTKGATMHGQRYDEWHLGCDCIAVPVFEGHETEWEGYAEFQKLEQLWIDHAEGSGKKALKSFAESFAELDPTAYSPVTNTSKE